MKEERDRQTGSPVQTPSEKQSPTRSPEIWAVGGGKGGTGKTFVMCQLATSLALKGNRVILIDADFGGANVHTFFGIQEVPFCIGHFFEKKFPLEDILLETPLKNLSLIAGTIGSISTANMNHAQKIRLFKKIRTLPADYVLLDLGGGTGIDTVDAFLLADRMVVVAVPEITAIENMYQFLKCAMFRKLSVTLRQAGFKDTARETWARRHKYDIRNMQQLADHLKQKNPGVADLLGDGLPDLDINIVLNKVRNVREIQEGFSIRSVCIKYIGVEALYSGYIEYDYQFWRYLSLVQASARANVSHNIRGDVVKIINHITSGGQMKINSIRAI